MKKKDIVKDENKKVVKKTKLKKNKEKSNLKVSRHPIIKFMMNLMFIVSSCLITSASLCLYSNINFELNITLLSIGIILLILSSIYICKTCGKTMKSDKIHFILFDKIYFEVLALLEFIIGFGYTRLMMELIELIKFDCIAEMIIMQDLIIKSSTYTALFTITTLILGKPVIKHVKNKSLIEHSIIGNIVFALVYLFKKLYLEGNMYKRYVISITSIFIIAAIGNYGLYFAFLITIFAAITYVIDFNNAKHSIRKYKEVDNLNRVKNVDLNELIDEVSLIKEDVNKMVNQKMDNERKKMSIVMDSVHDMNMPLNSIIDSIEKLCEKGTYDKETQKHIETIKSRAMSLKALGNDTIQKSELLSDDIKIKLDKIDMFTFITKGLMEIEEDIKNSNISFKLNIRKQKILVYADQNMLWRIIENLISDVYKHAKKGARVFLEIDENEDYALISMKNEVELGDVSKELFAKRYLMKDKGITSLNVAKNLTSIQNGQLSAQIKDGMFEVDVMIPLYKK